MYPLNPASGTSTAPAVKTVRCLPLRRLMIGSTTVSEFIRRRIRRIRRKAKS